MDETVNPASVRQWPGAHRTACRAAYAAVAVAGDGGPVMRLLSRWRGGQSRPVRSEVNMGGRGCASGFAPASALHWFAEVLWEGQGEGEGEGGGLWFAGAAETARRSQDPVMVLSVPGESGFAGWSLSRPARFAAGCARTPPAYTTFNEYAVHGLD